MKTGDREVHSPKAPALSPLGPCTSSSTSPELSSPQPASYCFPVSFFSVLSSQLRSCFLGAAFLTVKVQGDVFSRSAWGPCLLLSQNMTLLVTQLVCGLLC